MKVNVQRRVDRESTIVQFEITDSDIREAERKCGAAGMRRPPRLEAHGEIHDLTFRDWIEFVNWMAMMERVR